MKSGAKLCAAIIVLSLLFVGGTYAALLTYFGIIESDVNILQSVLLDDKDSTQMPIEEDFEAVGGDVICKYHWLRSRAHVPVTVELVSYGNPTGVVVKYFAVGTSEKWNVPANLGDANLFDDVEANITKTVKTSSIEFKVEIISDNPVATQYGMGIAISTDINIIGFQVWYAEYLAEPDRGWYYQEYGEGWGTRPAIALPYLGIAATGVREEKVFTVDIPFDLLGGCGAEYYYAIQFRTNLLGTWPGGLDLWAQTDATQFATQTVGTEITTPITLEPGEVLPFYICYYFAINIAPGLFTIKTEVRPA